MAAKGSTMNTYVTELVRYLVAQSWQIAALAVAVAIMTFVLRHRSAHIRYLLWLIVLAKCLVPPLYAVPLRVVPPVVLDEIPDVLMWPDLPTSQSAVSGPASTREPGVPAQESTRRVQSPRIAKSPLPVSGWLGIVWVLGAGVLGTVNLLRALRGRHWLRKSRKPLPSDIQAGTADTLRAFGLRSLPPIWIVEGVGQPFVWGLLRGSLYVPAGFLSMENSEHWRGVLAHELSHIIRFDAAVNSLQIIAQAVFWFHPLVWWANRQIRIEREKCCDEVAVARLHIHPKDYCSAVIETLASMKPSTQPVPSLAVAGPVKHIEERVRTMLRPERRFYKHAGVVNKAMILLLAALVVPSTLVFAARVTERTAHEKDDTVRSSPMPAVEKHMGMLQNAFARGVDVDMRDSWGHTLLHGACMKDNREEAEFLLDKGADVNAGNGRSITPLHTAAGRGYVDIVKLLLERNADINAKDDHGATPLWYAKNGVVYSFELFGSFSKHVMAQWKPENPGCKEAAGLLIERGAVECAPVISLHEAAYNGMIEKVKSLVAEGANVNAMDDRLAATPLHLATSSNQAEVVEFLIAHGADVNARNRWDQTPLHAVLGPRRTKIAELLRKHGATLEPSTETSRVKVSTSVFKSATAKFAIPEKCLQIPEQMQACAANLQKIHAAIKRYEEDMGQLPVWLSDLVPDYVSKEMLLCPTDSQVQTQPRGDPKLPCTYGYQFSMNRGSERFGGGPIEGMTSRDRKIAQLASFGDIVPLCRCSLHGQMWLSVSVGGQVYVTGPFWEGTIMPNYKVGSELSEKPTK